MPTGLSIAKDDAILNALRAGGTTLVAPAGTYAKLHVGDPGPAGTANPALGDATRRAFTQAASSGGSGLVMNGTPPVWTNAGTTETISDMTVWDTAAAGVFQYSFHLTTPQAWVSGNTATQQSLTAAIGPNAA